MRVNYEETLGGSSLGSDLGISSKGDPEEYGELAGVLSNKICMVAFSAFCFKEGYEKWFSMWLDVKCVSDYVSLDNSDREIARKCLRYIRAVYFDKEGNMDFSRKGDTPKNIIYSMEPHFAGETARLMIFIENMLRVNLRVSLHPNFRRSAYSKRMFDEFRKYPIMFRSFDIVSPFHKEFPTAIMRMARLLESSKDLQREEIYEQIIVSYLESVIKTKCLSEYVSEFYPFDTDSACELELLANSDSTDISELRPISMNHLSRSVRSDKQSSSVKMDLTRGKQKVIEKIARSMSLFRSFSRKIPHKQLQSVIPWQDSRARFPGKKA